jgi:hypothetical protein
MEPPVMLWVISLSPGLSPSIFAGVVLPCQPAFRVRSEDLNSTYLGVFAALKEGSHPDKTNVVVPHDRVDGFFAGKPELVLEDFKMHRQFAAGEASKKEHHIPSKLSLPVFWEKSFFPLLYGIRRQVSRMQPELCT